MTTDSTTPAPGELPPQSAGTPAGGTPDATPPVGEPPRVVPAGVGAEAGVNVDASSDAGAAGIDASSDAGAPGADASARAPLPPLQTASLRVSSPFAWLAGGWRDLRSAWVQSLIFGAFFWVMTLVIKYVFLGSPEYTLTVISGCFLVGPFLAMGLYDISRRRERGLAQDFGASMTCWSDYLSNMGLLVLVLIVIELLWGRASLVVFAVFFNTGMPSTTGVVDAVFNPKNIEFVIAYLIVGGFFAGLVFSTCAISIPMILDRDVDAVTAGIRSIQSVVLRPDVMVLWGLLIVVLMLASFASPWSIGVLFLVPLLGHATWHAYRQLMPADAVAAPVSASASAS